MLSGTIIHPVDDGSQSSRVTIITQMKLKGSAPQFVKNSYLTGSPLKRMSMLKKFYIKHQADEDRNMSLSESEKDIKITPASSPTKKSSTGGSIENIMD